MAKQDQEAGKETGDVWNVVEFTTDEKPWSEKNGSERALTVATTIFKVILAVGILYLFIISLDLMANSFRILGGKQAGRAFRDSDLFDNPLAGLVTGILVTVLVQSSSTSTSIIITMTAGNLIEVKNAIPMIMGANIGTSVTNTLVSLGSFANKNEYRRAFAGATVHDCFNFLTVIVFLPIEAATGLLRHIAEALTNDMGFTDDEEKGSKTDFLKKLTKPVASRLLGIDKKLITKIAQTDDADTLAKYEKTTIIKQSQSTTNHLFLDTPMSDGVAGVLMVIVSLAFLCICLMMLVKLLMTIFRGRTAIWFRAALNLEFKSIPFLANYVLIVFGMGITILFQSSSVTTSTLTPLAGIGLVRLDKMFAFTVGANIGTTCTGILSALVADKRKTAMTVAMTHTLFNLVGTLVWYPIPIVRAIPICMAKLLGNIAADVRWFPLAYIIVVFGLFPLLFLGLSVASPWLAAFVGVPIILCIIVLVVIAGLRENRPDYLPAALKKDPQWLINSLRCDKLPEEDAQSTGAKVGTSADMGKDDWQAAPAAWGTGWIVVLALLAVVFNSKWADVTYTKWDKRDHFGIGGWSSCSNAFEDSMPWAQAIDSSLCTTTVLNDCGKDLLVDCKKAGFSSRDGANSAYEGSWVDCREKCLTSQWKQWCEAQQCAGGEHKVQCSNVTEAVTRPYTVKHMPPGNAWEKGDRCREVSFMIRDVDGDIESAAGLAVSGVIFASIGLGCLVFYSMRQDKTKVLFVSLAFWLLSWVLLLAAWAVFTSAVDKDAEMMVEAESRKGVVMAVGRFGDIINGAGGYTYAFVIGAWLVSLVPISLIILRIKAIQSKGETAPPAVREI